MGRTRRSYGPWSQAMLRALRERGLLKVEALVAWMGERGLAVDRTLVSHWIAGRTHLPADLLPLLAEFTGRPEQVFGVFVRAVQHEVVRIAAAPPEDEELVDLLLAAGASLGRLQQALFDARSPDSPGGVDVTAAERVALKALLDELIQLLADVRGRLQPDSRGESQG
jgi:hypothetical protein